MAAKVLTHINMDGLRERVGERALLVNNMSLATSEDREFLKDLAINTYKTTDTVSMVPSCLCGPNNGGLTGEHRLGKVCISCGHEVKSLMTSEIESTLWIGAPRVIGRIPTPLTWVFCSQALDGKRFSVLSWICSPYSPSPDERCGQKVLRAVDKFNGLGIPRGLKSFHDNFDIIAENVILPTVVDVRKRNELAEFFRRYRTVLFTEANPIPSKVAMVVEETGVNNYFDKTIDSAVEAAFTAADTFGDENLPRLEGRFTTVMNNLAEFSVQAIRRILLKKSGFLRRVCYGLRIQFAFRSVITSYHEPHDYRHVKVPYSLLLNTLNPFVIQKLIKEHKMTFRQAYQYVQDHAKDYDPLCWAILEQLIDETPPDLINNPATSGLPSTLQTRQRTGRGIGCTGTRFPSLDRGSTQSLFIVGISKTTIEVSTLILKSWNADSIRVLHAVMYVENLPNCGNVPKSVITNLS